MEETLSKFGRSDVQLCGKGGAAISAKLLANAGSANRARRIMCVSLGEKGVEKIKVGIDRARALRAVEDFLQGRLHLHLLWEPLRAAPSVAAEARFTKLASWRRLKCCASPPLALPVARRQPDISSQQSLKENRLSRSHAGASATRVSDCAVLGDSLEPHAR